MPRRSASIWQQRKKATLRPSQFIVGGMYYQGLGTDPNRKEALRWLLKAAEQGVWSPESLRILGTMYLQGTGVPQNFQQARNYLERAAELGDLTAKKNLAYMYFNGLTGKKDYKQALKLYKEAALMGDSSSQYNVGLMYARGLGTAIDRVKAYAWFSLAASQGNLAARVASNDLMARMNWDELNQAQALSVQLFKEVSSIKALPCKPTRSGLCLQVLQICPQGGQIAGCHDLLAHSTGAGQASQVSGQVILDPEQHLFRRQVFPGQLGGA